MRFGISATSWILPKNLRTRLRPVNVCAISSSFHPGELTVRLSYLFARQCRHDGRRHQNAAPLVVPSQRHFNSTFAPTFSSCALILPASSLFTPSLTFLGAPSTRSFASLRPRLVIARTSLMTSIFLSPIACRTTVNSVFSSTGAAAPAPGPATATAAGADTPHFSSSSFASSPASRTVSWLSSFTILFSSAIVVSVFGSNHQSIAGTASGGLALLAIGPEHPRKLRSRRVDDPRNLGRRGNEQPDNLGPQLVERRKRSERLHRIDVQGGLSHRAAEDHELLVPLREVDGDLRCRHRIARVGDHRWALKAG